MLLNLYEGVLPRTMPKSAKISLLAMSVALVLCIFLGVNARGVSAASDAAQDGAYRQINVYGEVLQHIQNDYVVTPDIPKVTNGALRGLLESLDADSSYLTPADYKAYKEDLQKTEKSGSKAQIGVVVSKRYGYATVVSVVPGSPADKANLSDGDIVEAIGVNGTLQDTRDMSLAVIQLLLDGAPGSELQIAVIRPRKADPGGGERAAGGRDDVRGIVDFVAEAGDPGSRAREPGRSEVEGDEQGRQQEDSARSARCGGRQHA
jgi:carboxyl-terminal processing protease